MSSVALEMEPYFQRVKTRLRCPKKRRGTLLERVHRAAEEFSAENPEATPEEMEQYLGDPAEVARELMETLDPAELERYQRRKKLGALLCVGLLTVALVSAIIGVIYLKNSQVVFEVTETLTIYEEVPGP